MCSNRISHSYANMSPYHSLNDLWYYCVCVVSRPSFPLFTPMLSIALFTWKNDNKNKFSTLLIFLVCYHLRSSYVHICTMSKSRYFVYPTRHREYMHMHACMHTQSCICPIILLFEDLHVLCMRHAYLYPIPISLFLGIVLLHLPLLSS